MVIVRIVKLVSVVSVVAVLFSGCNNEQSLSGRDPGAPTQGSGGDQKPDPNNIVEKVKPLTLQVPVLDEAEFMNSMQLVFGTAEQAAYTFSFVPEETGSLYFTLIQSRLKLEECEKPTKRKVKFNVYWQEDLGTSRKVLKSFTPDITDFQFEKGKKYFLTYALLDLKGQLSDCKSATLKFAAFKQKYSSTETPSKRSLEDGVE